MNVFRNEVGSDEQRSKQGQRSNYFCQELGMDIDFSSLIVGYYIPYSLPLVWIQVVKQVGGLSVLKLLFIMSQAQLIQVSFTVSQTLK